MSDINNDNSVSIQQWMKGKTDDEIRELFFNMSLTMKYIHEKGYCINSFSPLDIEILNNSVQNIKYDVLLKLPDNKLSANELIHEDIYNMAFLNIGIYSDCLKYLKPNFLKENFNSFITFLPEGDVSYYRGIVLNGASVYFSDYYLSKRDRDLNNLESEISNGESGKSNNKRFVKSNGHSISDNVLNNNSLINKQIYNQLDSVRDSAFVLFMIFPTILFIVGVVIGIILFFSKMS